MNNKLTTKQINEFCAMSIKLLRLKKNITQNTLAKKINITQGTLSAYELSVREIPYATIFQIAKELEVDMSVFEVHSLQELKKLEKNSLQSSLFL